MTHPDVPEAGIRMIRQRMDRLPDHPLPAEYCLRSYRPGDASRWTAIHIAADPYIKYDDGTFDKEFGAHEQELEQRQFYLCDEAGDAVGTATAWWREESGERWGLVHWVAISPQAQGRGLAKPLLSAVCRRIRELGDDRAQLGTSTWRIPAVNLYLQFGFVPYIRHDEDRAAWRSIRRYLKTDIGEL